MFGANHDVMQKLKIPFGEWLSRLFVFLIIILSACSTTRHFPSQPPTGILTVQNQRSGERDTVRYQFPDGSLNIQGAWRLSYLMRDVRTEQMSAMDPRLFSFLDQIYATLHVPSGTPIIITSGYRTVETNAALRQSSSQVAERSYHTRAQAADIKIPGINGSVIANVAMQLHKGGVAFYPRSGHVHVDVGPVRTWPTD